MIFSATIDKCSDAFKLLSAKRRLEFLIDEIYLHNEEYAKKQVYEAEEHLRLLARDIITFTTSPTIH